MPVIKMSNTVGMGRVPVVLPNGNGGTYIEEVDIEDLEAGAELFDKLTTESD